MYGEKNPSLLKDQTVPHSGGGTHMDETGLSFSSKWCGRTFGDGVITVLGFGGFGLGCWGVFCCFGFCKSRMCPVLIGIVTDLHKKSRPEPFVKYQFGQHAFLPCWHHQKGNCAGPRACSAPAGRCSTCGELGFFSAAIGRAAVDQRKLSCTECL